jgi:membrane-associated phospholipid phosphatase
MPLDLALFEAANRLVCLSPATFYQALMLSDRPSWVLASVAFVAMWFPTAAPGEAIERVELQARSRVVLLFGALVGSFGAARGVAALIHRVRPIAALAVPSPIPAAEWASIQSALSKQGAFPSDHAAMFAVVVVGLFAFDRRAGRLGLLLALGFAVLRIGVGFHWPSDMAAGALIGAVAARVALGRRPQVAGFLEPILLWVQWRAVLTYPLLFLLALDFSQKFAWLFGLLAIVAGHPIAH